jgi:excisionase family DNA binding protein
MTRTKARCEPVALPPRTELLTYPEAGEQLRVHAKTIRDMAEDGRLVKVRLGPQTLRVTAESVEALIHRSMASA